MVLVQDCLSSYGCALTRDASKGRSIPSAQPATQLSSLCSQHTSPSLSPESVASFLALWLGTCQCCPSPSPAECSTARNRLPSTPISKPATSVRQLPPFPGVVGLALTRVVRVLHRALNDVGVETMSV